jgi:BirA family biotin operon repressor/biotin-[acetyl-CoA-carboxylase] ligase
VLEAVHAVAVEYAAAGLAPFREEWLAADALRDRPVRVLTPQAERDGIARGIDADGALRVEFGGRVEPVVAGDVSLRAVA